MRRACGFKLFFHIIEEEKRMRAIMYVAHGSRLPEKNHEFRRFVEQIMQQRPETHQKIAFLEKEDETMALVGEALMEAGASEITVIPMLLFPAMHATKDIPEQVTALKKAHPDVTFQIADTFGAEEETIAVAASRIKAASPARSAAILVIAHGSATYHEPRIQMQRVAEKLSAELGNPVTLGMLHGEPNYRQVATELAATNDDIYWMPYFLFTGQLVDKIRAGIKEVSEHTPNTTWHETNCLELDSSLAPAVLRKITEVSQ
ncbi:sirohydrochlorin chelatase [Listeria grandensis]|nr:sirohydrochlorin chelatase [Listeria grandensis]